MTEQVIGNKCMKLDKTELSWAAARNVCKEAGADLAVVSLIMMMARAFLIMMMIMVVIMDFGAQIDSETASIIKPGLDWEAEQRLGRPDGRGRRQDVDWTD